MSMEPIAADPALMQRMAAKHDDAAEHEPAAAVRRQGRFGDVVTVADIGSIGPVDIRGRDAVPQLLQFRPPLGTPGRGDPFLCGRLGGRFAGLGGLGSFALVGAGPARSVVPLLLADHARTNSLLTC